MVLSVPYALKTCPPIPIKVLWVSGGMSKHVWNKPVTPYLVTPYLAPRNPVPRPSYLVPHTPHPVPRTPYPVPRTPHLALVTSHPVPRNLSPSSPFLYHHDFHNTLWQSHMIFMCKKRRLGVISPHTPSTRMSSDETHICSRLERHQH